MKGAILSLKQTFTKLLEKHAIPKQVRLSLWTDIESRYSETGRYYHNLEHLVNLLAQLSPLKSQFHDWDAVLLGLFYHDIIYDVKANDNEAQSAEFALSHLAPLIPSQTLSIAEHFILATQSHAALDEEANYFTDADLSILGASWEIYAQYAKNIRREYQCYSDEKYAQGRKAVLQQLLAMPALFKTAPFYARYEVIARQNLEREHNQFT